MKNLIRIFLILTIIGGAVSLHSACSDENDCSLAGRPMMYCTIYTINPDNPTIALKDTLDSLTITALGTDSIILNNEKNVHTLMLPLRYTSDTTVFIFRYDPKRREKDFDTLYIVQQLSLIHISEPTRLGMISYAVFCLKKKTTKQKKNKTSFQYDTYV